MTRPDTCGAAGGAVVLWIRMTVDLTGVNGAVFSSEEQATAARSSTVIVSYQNQLRSVSVDTLVSALRGGFTIS